MRVLRQMGIAVVGTALLALAMWFHQVEPQARSHDLQPLRNSGRIGQDVSNSVFSIRVERVELAKSLKASGSLASQKNITTDGIFLIIHLQAKATQKPYTLDQVRLESGGYTFTGNGRAGTLDSTVGTFEPMIWRKAVVSFEIPRNRLAGARLVVGESGLLTQLTAEAAVDLGITPAKAGEMIAHAIEGYDPGSTG
ncbi:MAG: hypothetical protein JWN52_4621 [Actinomycetia bacterium]|nr:hypothetical protein [Actinomycetes bacterium]